MRNTFTNLFLSFSTAEEKAKRQTYQSDVCGFNALIFTKRLKLKRLSVILFAFIVLVAPTVKAQFHTMAAGNYTLTGSVTYYDPGGAGGNTCPSVAAGNYPDNANITETMNANAGQRIVVN